MSWIVALIFSSRARAAFRARAKLAAACMVALGLLSSFDLFLLYQFHLTNVQMEQEEAARNTILTQTTILGSISMPAGTQLHSRVAGKIEQFDIAEFPHPVGFNGLMVTRLNRTVYPDLEGYFTVTSIEASLAFDQAIDGWTCQSQQPVMFDVTADKVSFESCALSSGNRLGDWMVPAGAMLRANHHITHGSTIFLDSDKATLVRGLPLEDARLDVNTHHQMIGFNDAVLASDFRLGPMRYPAGTRVKSKDWGLRDQNLDSVLFSPVQGQVAKFDHGADVPFGSSVVQTLAGDVQAILSNQDAGVIDLEPFILVK